MFLPVDTVKFSIIFSGKAQKYTKGAILSSGSFPKTSLGLCPKFSTEYLQQGNAKGTNTAEHCEEMETI